GMKKISTLKLIIEAVNATDDKKRGCIDVLLAAGAGLDKSIIPSHIYSMYGVDSGQIDFLLIAKKNNTNKTFYSVKEVQDAIKLEWQFETDQIARAILECGIQKRPQVQELST